MSFSGPHTAETRAKIARGLRRAHAEGRRAGAQIGPGLERAYADGRKSADHPGTFLPGEDHRNWQGEDIAYRTAHKRVEHARGRPQGCEVCGASDPGRYEWAVLWRTAARILTDQKGRRFSVDVADYCRMCCACHRAYDREDR